MYNVSMCIIDVEIQKQIPGGIQSDDDDQTVKLASREAKVYLETPRRLT